MLYPIPNKKNFNTEKILIYERILRPLLTYVCPVKGKCANSHIDKLQIFQNKVLQIITNAAWSIRNVNLHKDLQIQEIIDHIKTLFKNFYSSLLNSSGSLRYELHIRLNVDWNVDVRTTFLINNTP